MEHITGIILAAGTSSRMGSANKLLLKYREHTVVEETLNQLMESRVDEILIVTGYQSDRIESALEGYLSGKVRTVYNGGFQLGRAESIKCAVRQLTSATEAALFMVADKPGVSSALINRAIDRYRIDRPAILYVEMPGGRGHPIIFARSMFSELLRLEGDRVGNELVAKYRDKVVTVSDHRRQIDIDCEADYRIATAARIEDDPG